MKKIFSTVAMAIVAFTAVVSMSSCSNDDASSFNAAPQVTAQPVKHSFEYKAQVTSDVLTYLDVVITRTDGATSQDLTFTEATKINDCPAMQLSDQYFSENSNVKYSVKVTPKSNWKELLEATGSNKVRVGTDLFYSGRNEQIIVPNGPVVPEFTIDSDKAMEIFVDAITKALTPTSISSIAR